VGSIPAEATMKQKNPEAIFDLLQGFSLHGKPSDFEQKIQTIHEASFHHSSLFHFNSLFLANQENQ
jgi:hypothetical protein